ncbi:uncharacterized protein LOC119461000 isoform X1 [Dermacentor silvarum]|uniref:uncharacterized protein LOC119461000 isoform X1 n=1 Tax=Dermacentor silvarum TaxID=543639 RepID=UPI00189AEB6E|nr:uncharacterized protein LOC119461000 isoform X1 [Dermacentor silvarum]
MAYINIAEWTPEHVADWLRGLDDIIIPYVHFFLNNNIDGHHLLTLGPDDLTSLNISKVGHQELILEAVDQLRQLHYKLITENLQSLALKLGCRARSVYNDIKRMTTTDQDNFINIATSVLADVSEVLLAVKSFVSWLDSLWLLAACRAPFEGQERYTNIRQTVLKLGIELASTAQRDHFAAKPYAVIQSSCYNLADICDIIIQECHDSLIIQPASLDVATVKKKTDEEWGMQINSSYSGIHVVGGVKFQSPSHRCGKVDVGDEIVQINYQTVVGWQLKHLVYMLQEHPTEVLLTLKKRPRHTNILGQVIVLRPYRIPLKKVTYGKVMWPENGVQPVNIEEVFPVKTQQEPASPRAVLREVEDDDSAFLPDAAVQSATSTTTASVAAPSSIRAQVFPPRSRAAIHRRATVSGASPTVTKAPVSLQDLVAGGIPGLFGGSSKKKDAVFRSVSHDPGCHGAGGKLTVADGSCVEEGKEPETKGAEHQPEKKQESVTNAAKDAPMMSKGRTASDSAVVPLVGRSFGMAGTLSSRLREARGLTTGESAKHSSGPPAPASGSRGVADVRSEVGSQSPRERRLFGPGTGKRSPMVTLKVPKIEDLKHNHMHSRSSKAKAHEAPSNAQANSSSSDAHGAKVGFGAKESPKKPLAQPPAMNTKTQCSESTLGNRGVPCPELGVAECEGWLLRRWWGGQQQQAAPLLAGGRTAAPAMAALPPWRRRWVLLRGPQLFLYATPQDQKAECLLYVPGFVVSLAPDCKSKNGAFKLSNSENTFYFATESQADTSRWLTKLQQAAKHYPSYSGSCLWASDSDEDAVLDSKMFKPASSSSSFSSHKISLGPAPLDRPRQPSPKPMPRTIFLRSAIVPPQLTDRSATLSPRRTTGEPPTTSASNSSLPRNRESSKSPPSVLCPSSLELSSECSDGSTCSLTAKQRLSGAWDRYSDALGVVQPAKRDFSTAKSKPPSGLYVNVSFKHSSSTKEPSTPTCTGLPPPSEQILGANPGNPARVPTLAPSSPALSRAVQRRPSDSSKLSRSKTADSFPQMQTPKGETLLDREYNRVFKKSPSASSSPDPAALSDSPATSPVPLPVLTNSLLPRCATSQEIKDLYTNRRNSWRGSQQELMIPLSSVGSSDLGSPLEGCVQSPDYSYRDYASPDYASQRPDVIPSQYHQGRSRPPQPEEAGTDPWVPRSAPSPSQGVERTPRGRGEKLPSSSFLRAGSAPASSCCQAAPSPTPTKTSSRFFHSPKFLKKFASSTREGLSNILRSPRLERKKLTTERDMYGSPKLSRSAGVRLLKSSASASAVSSSPAEVPEESSPSPLTHKSGSSSSLNSSTSAGSFVTSSSSSHCYAEVFAPPGSAPLARPETPETPRARPTMGVSMLRGKRRTSSSAAGSEERSFSPCSFASSAGGSGSGAPWARDDGSVFGEETSPGGGDAFQFGHGTDGSPESVLGSGSERE